MALNELEDKAEYKPGVGLSNLNPDAPDFAKDIVVKQKNMPLDVAVDYQPHNPYVITYPNGTFSSTSLEGIQPGPSFFESAKAQAYKMNATAQGLNAVDTLIDQQDPTFYDKPDGWTSKSNVEKYVNVRSQYVKALLDAQSPKHQDQIYQKILEEQKADDDVANGSWLAWLIGGAAGIATDPMTYIPIAGWVKYGKISSSLLMSGARALPGATAYGVLSSAAEQMDKVNGNLHDFVVDSFVKTAFAAALFGGIGAAATITEKMALWDLKGFAKAHIDGMDFKFTTDEAGKITGYKAIDTTGSLSAAEVSYYDDMAKSTFHKSGVFKIPYVGQSIIKLAGMPVFGSPLINLINSKSQVVRAVIDRVADHNFITEGVAEGKVAPQKFASLMNQVFAKLRSLSVQYDALHLERNGFDIKNRIASSTVDTALNIHDRSLKLLGKDLDKTGYISKEAFNDEVQQVLHSAEPSEHASVNEAAALHREQMDSTYKAYRQAYNLPDDWMPPKTAEAFLTRVYDTPYMNANKHKWISTVSNWLKEADDVISARMQPILDLEKRIEDFEQLHGAAIYELGLRNIRETNEELSQVVVPFTTEVGPGIKYKTMPTVNRQTETIGTEIAKTNPALELSAMKARLKAMKESLQNELRTNSDLQLHVEDWNSLSADEGKELNDLLKPLNKIKADIKKQEQNHKRFTCSKVRINQPTKQTKTEKKLNLKQRNLLRQMLNYNMK